MHLRTPVAAALWLVLTHATSLPNHADTISQRSTKGIQWTECPQDLLDLNETPTKLDCANFTVPLDYTDLTSNKTVDLQLLRAHALKGPSRGSVLANYGGPGQTGRSNLAKGLGVFFTATGNVFDGIAFDPRGTVNTLTATCYNASEAAAASLYPFNPNASDTALAELWASKTNYANTCFQRHGEDVGPYVGTAFAARDFISVVDALGEDGLLRYFGGSYGSILGATIAAMFPDRIDKVFMSAIVNAHEYFHSTELEYLTSNDDVLSGFFAGCAAAGPESCAIAREGVSGSELEEEFYTHLYDLKDHPIPNGLTTVLTYPAVKQWLSSMMYTTSLWPAASQALAAIYSRNATLALSIIASIPESGFSTPDALEAIHCSDKALFRFDLLEDLEKAGVVQDVLATSPISGDTLFQLNAECAQWRSEAKEVYHGDFRASTRNPLLFMSNRHGWLAPLESGRNMSSGFEGARLLVNNGYGHALVAQPSRCILETVADYFVNGTMPENEKMCEPSIPLFGNGTLEELLEEMNPGVLKA